MIEFTYAIPNVWVYFSHGGQTDVIYHAKFEVTGKKSNKTFTSSECMNIEVSNLSNYIAFDQVTQAKVVSWIEAQHSERVTEIKQSIEDHIDEQITPIREMRTLSS